MNNDFRHLLPPPQTYRRAAESLDERTPPSSACAEPLRKRIRELYVTCMCNAAVAGFKAAAAAPAPGEAHRLVVDVCTRALERSGGNCPKVSEDVRVLAVAPYDRQPVSWADRFFWSVLIHGLSYYV